MGCKKIEQEVAVACFTALYSHQPGRAAWPSQCYWDSRRTKIPTRIQIINIPVGTTYLFTYLLTPRSREANRFSAGQEITAFYGTRRFITAFTSARHLSLSWARSIHSIPPHPTSWRFILILPSHLRLGLQSDLFSSGFLTKTLYQGRI